MNPIDATAINAAFPDLNCDWVESIESTQKSVKANSLLIANEQVLGIGRRGNHWLTPKGNSICLSYRFSLSVDAKHLAGYQMTVALAVLKTIHHFEPNAQIKLKWPNDLFTEDSKFAGILINLIPKSSSETEIIVGIGLNWQLSSEQLASVDRPINNVPIKNLPKRDAFIIELIKSIKTSNVQYIEYGLSHFLDQWHKYDYLHGKSIMLVGENMNLTGIYAGINYQGELKIKTSSGTKHLSSGEVSVKPV